MNNVVYSKSYRQNDGVKRIVSITKTDRVEEMACITVDSPSSTFLAGESFTVTHNTTVLNALSGYFNDTQRIVTLEDNLELKINPRKRLAAPMETLPPNPNKEGDRGVTMRDLVRDALLMRPNGIIIGESKGSEAWDLTQALNTGHWGASTIHANSEYDGIYRLQSLIAQAELLEGDQILPLIASAFDFLVLLEHFPSDGSRKITSISEVAPYPVRDEASGRLTLPTIPLWEFTNSRITENDEVQGEWVRRNQFSEVRARRRHLHLTPDLTWEQLEQLSSLA